MKSSNNNYRGQKKLIDFYDNVNLIYKLIYPNYIEHNKVLAESLSKYIGFKEVKIFVDLGCGTSNILYELAKKHPNTSFFGIDFSSKTIEYCNTNYKCDNISYVEAEWQEGLSRIKKTKDISIDVISCFGNTITHYSPEKQLKLVSLIKNSLSANGIMIYDTYKGWNEKLISNENYYFEPKGLTKDKNGMFINSDFFSKYDENIAIRNILITTYKGFNEPPTDIKHYITWQYPLHKDLDKTKIHLKDSLGIFDYYKLYI